MWGQAKVLCFTAEWEATTSPILAHAWVRPGLGQLWPPVHDGACAPDTWRYVSQLAWPVLSSLLIYFLCFLCLFIPLVLFCFYFIFLVTFTEKVLSLNYINTFKAWNNNSCNSQDLSVLLVSMEFKKYLNLLSVTNNVNLALFDKNTLNI